MPELPEVETTLRGLAPFLTGSTLSAVIIRNARLRWPIPDYLAEKITDQTVNALSRRGKYLLIHFVTGTLLIHLGMSGHLRITSQNEPTQKHDHVDFVLSNGTCLRYTDPRRFGAILWSPDPSTHPLLDHLGPEPLGQAFDAQYLLDKAQNRRCAIKTFIMNAHVVVGVGNIYATEALFDAKIHPALPSYLLSQTQSEVLVQAIRDVLSSAIEQGGTTLKDFFNTDGKPGYFVQRLQAYGRAGLPCYRCENHLQSISLGQRTTVFCPCCQKLPSDK